MQTNENVDGRCTSSHENKILRSRSVVKQKGMVSGFRKTATVVTRPERWIEVQTNVNFLSNLAQFLLELEKFQTKVVEKIKTRILRSITFFFEKCAVYEITWKNIAQPDRPHMTIWRMRIACWIPKATNTHSRYVILIAFPCNNICTNAPPCHLLLALPDLFWYWMLSSTLLDKFLYDTFVKVQFLQEMLS